jgi:tetratricopeptide (TPR) repeat protein
VLFARPCGALRILPALPGVALLAVLVVGCGHAQKLPDSEAAASPSPAPGTAPTQADAASPPSAGAEFNVRARDLFASAVARAQTGELESAAAQFQQAWDAEPRLLYAAFNAGVLLERLGKLAEAREVYERAVKAAPDFEPASGNLVRLLVRLGKAAEAEADLKARVERFPASAGLRNQLAELLLGTGKLDGAEQEARKVLKEDERSIPAMITLASVYHAKKRFELAKMVLENARQIDPKDPAVWNRLAFVDLALGNRAQALEDLKTAASLRPDYPEAHLNYGAMLNDAEDFAGAVKELELAVQYAPDSAVAHLDLGNAYRGTKEFAKAQEHYERALQLDPKMIEVHFDLAVLYLDGEKPDLPALARLQQGLTYLDQYAAAGGEDPKLAQYRKDATSAVEREKKRLAREEKERVRKEAEAKKKQEAELQRQAQTQPKPAGEPAPAAADPAKPGAEEKPAAGPSPAPKEPAAAEGEAGGTKVQDR